jgi:cytochrome c oxidase assembly protein subunit 17
VRSRAFGAAALALRRRERRLVPLAARRLSVHRACTAPPLLAPPRRAAETRKPRDECVVMFGEEACAAQIDAHKACLRRDGFDVK